MDDFVLCKIYKTEELGRIASRVHQSDKVETKGQNVDETSFEQKDEEVEHNGQDVTKSSFEQKDEEVEHDGQDVTKSSFEQEKQMVMNGSYDQGSSYGSVIPQKSMMVPEISSYNNNCIEVDAKLMNSSSLLDVGTSINNEDWSSTDGTMLSINDTLLAKFTASPSMQNLSASLGGYGHLDVYGSQQNTSFEAPFNPNPKCHNSANFFSDEGHLMSDLHSSWMTADMKSILPSSHETMDMPTLPTFPTSTEGMPDLSSITGGHNSFTPDFDGQFPP